jgi:hypothetical protein
MPFSYMVTWTEKDHSGHGSQKFRTRDEMDALVRELNKEGITVQTFARAENGYFKPLKAV